MTSMQNESTNAGDQLLYGGKLWWWKNLANSLEKHIGGRKFGKFSPFSKQNLLYLLRYLSVISETNVVARSQHTIRAIKH